MGNVHPHAYIYILFVLLSKKVSTVFEGKLKQKKYYFKITFTTVTS